MKNTYLTTAFLTTLLLSSTATAYGLLQHPSEKGCLSVANNKVVLAVGDFCPSDPSAHSDASIYWKLEKVEGGVFLILHHAPEKGQIKKCLTIAADKVMLLACNKTNTRQQWKLSDNGEKTTILNKDKCLAAFTHTKGATVEMQKCEKKMAKETTWMWKISQ
jgi:hypothetical protein